MEKIKISLDLSLKEIDNIYECYNNSELDEISDILNKILCKVMLENSKIEEFTKKINNILL